MTASGSNPQALQTQDFNAFRQNQIAAIQSANPNLFDFNQGSVLLALVNSNASLAMWIQGLITSLLAISRLQTSTGNNVDTFIQQFGFSRPGGTFATGTVTFSRNITTSNSYVPVGTVISTNIAGQSPIQFQVVANSSNPNFNASEQRYEFGVGGGTSTMSVSVKCLQVGSLGNVAIGTITVINSPLTNVTSVNNTGAMTGGTDQASDQQTRADFVAYLQGLFAANYDAINEAVLSAYQSLGVSVERYQIVELVDYTTQLARVGYFYIIYDDGTGSPSSNLGTQITNNVDAVRGLAIAYEVQAPTSNTAMTFSMSILLNADFDTSALRTQITAAVNAALVAWTQGIEIGGTFYYTKIVQLVYDQSPYILDVTSVLMNSGSSDVTANAKGVLYCATDTPAMVTYL